MAVGGSVVEKGSHRDVCSQSRLTTTRPDLLTKSKVWRN